MRKLLIGAGALLLAGAAGAQVLGAGAGGAVGGIGAGVSGDVVGAVSAPTDGDATRGAAKTAGGATARMDRAAGDVAADSSQGDSGKRVRVASGASIRVGQGTRCYYDNYDFDPVYRDGYYYCERTGPTVAARVRSGR